MISDYEDSIHMSLPITISDLETTISSLEEVMLRYWKGHLYCNNMNPRYFPLAASALKLQQIPMFYIFPIEFGGASDIHKHQNSMILC